MRLGIDTRAANQQERTGPVLSLVILNRKLISCFAALSAVVALLAFSRSAQAEAMLVVEADTGKVLHAENATYPWYPASVTKLMTTYVTLKAMKDGRITRDTRFTVTRNA